MTDTHMPIGEAPAHFRHSGGDGEKADARDENLMAANADCDGGTLL